MNSQDEFRKRMHTLWRSLSDDPVPPFLNNPNYLDGLSSIETKFIGWHLRKLPEFNGVNNAEWMKLHTRYAKHLKREGHHKGTRLGWRNRTDKEEEEEDE